MRLALLAAVLPLAACGANLEAEAREGLATELRDAESAQFRGLKRDAVGTICGQVNAKNGFGAYVGFRPFYVSKRLSVVDDGETTFARDYCEAGNS